MRIFAQTVLFCAAVATQLSVKQETTETVITRVRNQEQCDALNGDGNTEFNQDACACFSLIQCEIACEPGFTLLPTEACSGCVPEEQLD